VTPPHTAAVRAEATAVTAPATSSASVRVRPATIADMLKVEPLVAHFAERGLMLPKTVEALSRNFREFILATATDGSLLGCGALRVYTAQLAEIGSLAVAEEAHGLGVGRRLVQGLEEEARKLGIGTVFALTLQDRFFERLGYHPVPKELFPLKVWADCRACPKLHACDEIAVVKDVGAL
jgi:amino-acid N-acetyltransferase